MSREGERSEALRNTMEGNDLGKPQNNGIKRGKYTHDPSALGQTIHIMMIMMMRRKRKNGRIFHGGILTALRRSSLNYCLLGEEQENE